MKAIISVCCLLLATQAMAMRFESGQQVTINQPVEGDLYVAGGTITINAPIHGDLKLALLIPVVGWLVLVGFTDLAVGALLLTI